MKPLKKVISECFSGKYTQKDINAIIRGKGGIFSYLNTTDTREVEKMIENGNSDAKLIYEAFAYQISKGIGELATVVGIFSYLNTTDTREVEKMIENGNSDAKLIYEAFAYQISKGIGELATVVDGNIDAIILTGGVA